METQTLDQAVGAAADVGDGPPVIVLAGAIARHILDQGWEDKAFISQYTATTDDIAAEGDWRRKKWATDFDTFKTYGYFSVPIVTDRVALGVAGHFEDMSRGYIHDLTRNGKVAGGKLESELVRAKLRFVPWEGADFTLQGFYSRRDDHAIVRDSNWHGNNARALKSDAESKARLIREMLQGGRTIEASEVLNSELIRRLSEQRATLRAQLAEQSSTLLDGHPRIKELKAQLADLDRQLRDEAGKVSRSLENDARIAGGRVDSLTASLDQMKKQATSTNSQDVQLRALEREAKAQRDLLESYLAKYREATARENIDSGPSDGRIISRATVSNIPAYPKKLPIVLIATLATLLLMSGLVVTGELLRMTAPRASVSIPSVARAPAVEPIFTEAPAATQAPVQVTAREPVEEAVQEPQPVVAEPDPQDTAIAPATEAAPPLNEIEQLAADICAPGHGARKVTVLGTAPGEDIALTALTLARLLARDLKVVVVDLAASSSVIPEESTEANAPGLAELMLGEASFSQIINKDRRSRVQLVGAGRPGFDRALLQSPRLLLAIDALMRVYDRVVLDAGAAADLPAELLTALGRAVVVPDASMDAEARNQMCAELKAAGFFEVTMLSKAWVPSQEAAVDPRGVAA